MQQLLKYISSFTDGRVRLRHPALMRGEVIDRLKTELAGIQGVQSAEFNPRTGSLLLQYDKHTLPRTELLTIGLRWASYFEGSSGVPGGAVRSGEFRRVFPTSRRLLNRGMLVSLVLTVVSGITGSQRLHGIAGCALSVLSGLHAYTHRKQL